MAIFGWYLPAQAQGQTYTLRLHHYMPADSVEHTKWLIPWARLIEEDSRGRLKIEVHPNMQLGGRATELYDQARQGTVDIVWTLAGYSPGRFPRFEVFELPWIAAADGIRSSAAAWDFYLNHARDEFADVKVLALFTHAKGTLFLRDRDVKRPDDIAQLPISVPSPTIGETVTALGAVAKTIPAPEIAKALTDNAIAGFLLPYQAVPSLNVGKAINRVTEFMGDRALYTSVYLFVMNKARYESLPEDLRSIVDERSGHRLSARLGWQFDVWERDGRRIIEQSGAQIARVDNGDLRRWRAAAVGRVGSWVAKHNASGGDGQMLLETVGQLIEDYAPPEASEIAPRQREAHFGVAREKTSCSDVSLVDGLPCH